MLTPPPPAHHFLDEQLVLARAVHAGDLAAVRSLAPSTDLATPGAEGITLLAFAFMAAGDEAPERLAMLTGLVRAGADVRQPVDAIGSVWEAALTSESPAFVRAILDGGVSANTPVGRSTPPLFSAASEDSVETMRHLIARGADLDARDTLGNSAAVHCLHAMQLDQAAELLARGASPDSVNLRGESFLWVLWTQWGRTLEGSAARAKIEEIRDPLVYEGRRKWPPDPPRVERDRLRAAGVDVVVPIGEER